MTTALAATQANRETRSWRARRLWTLSLLAADLLAVALPVDTAMALPALAPGDITTVAGGTIAGNATQIPQDLSSVAVSGSTVYVFSQAPYVEVLAIDTRTDRETVVAGNGAQGFSGDGGPATDASLDGGYYPAIAVDPAADLFIAGNGRIREVPATSGIQFGIDMTAGDIYTVAGGGSTFPPANATPATSTLLSLQSGLAVDSAGDLFVAVGGYGGAGEVFEVPSTTKSQFGQAMTVGDVYSVAGGSTNSGRLGDGGPATAAGLDLPKGLAVDPAGDVFIAETGDSRVREVANISITEFGQVMTAGDIYTVAGDGSGSFTGDGGAATSAGLGGYGVPEAVAFDPASQGIFIADGVRVREVPATTGTRFGVPMTDGDIYTVAGPDVPGNGPIGFSGDGGPATSAEMYTAYGVAADAAGDLFIGTDSYATLPQYAQLREVAAAPGIQFGQAMSTGHIYTVAGLTSAAGGPVPSEAEMVGPNAVGADAAGDLFVDDCGYGGSCDNRVLEVPATSGTRWGRQMTAGLTYSAAGTGAPAYSGDGGPAASAGLQDPVGLTVDAAGDLFVTDSDGPNPGDFNVVREVPAASGTHYGVPMTAGDIYTVAGSSSGGYSGDGARALGAQLSNPTALAIDATGDLFIADDGGYRVREVAAVSGTRFGMTMTAGDIYSVAGDGSSTYSGDGGPAASAGLVGARGMAFDAAGDLFLSDGNWLRMVASNPGTHFGGAMIAGDIYTLAGNGVAGSSGDRGPAGFAELNGPVGLVVDAKGNVVIADTGSNRVREIAAVSGTYFGVVMTAGDIYTVAGTGVAGFSGDGGAALVAQLDRPEGVALEPSGALLVADTANLRIREVAPDSQPSNPPGNNNGSRPVPAPGINQSSQTPAQGGGPGHAPAPANPAPAAPAAHSAAPASAPGAAAAPPAASASSPVAGGAPAPGAAPGAAGPGPVSPVGAAGPVGSPPQAGAPAAPAPGAPFPSGAAPALGGVAPTPHGGSPAPGAGVEEGGSVGPAPEFLMVVSEGAAFRLVGGGFVVAMFAVSLGSAYRRRRRALTAPAWAGGFDRGERP